MTTTVDASFISRVLVPSQALPAADAVMRDLLQQRTELVAPPLLAIEFGSSLRGLAARGRLTAVEARTCWSAFRDLGVALHFEIAWVERASEIAAAAGLSKVYDSTYLACAEALDAELVTCDEKFVAALPAALRGRVQLVAASS